MKLTYLGHSAFEICTNGQKILVDPFLVKSPNYDCSGVTDIFVTHGHSDHLGSAIEISKKTKAKITAIFELANYCSSKGANANGINLGSKITYNWGKVSAVPAFHSNSTPEGIYGGCPCGYVFEIENHRIYHAGDTCLNQEMKTTGEFYKPDISILPVGGYFTMDIKEAVKASEWLASNTIIPMHYNTFGLINVNINSFKEDLEKIGKRALIPEIGVPLEL